VSGEARRAVFLDRDGVLNPRPPEHTYLASAQQFEWLPGARKAVIGLKDAGWIVAVVSNQRGVARGLLTSDALAQIEQRIQRDLPPPATLDGFYYCVHDVDAGCDCRKPRPGLIVRAAAELGVDRSASWMIGDDVSDVAAGRAAGCRTILIASSGHDAGGADLVEPDLLSATRRLC
jgi:D-glycero-D-manno-heptose 1,7-bisphosphate phosphatase